MARATPGTFGLAAPSPLLDVRGLSVAFGDHIALRNVSFELERGETLALVGESGSGKSATALAILRLVEREGGRLTGGRIVLAGDPPLELDALEERALRRVRGARVSMVFQEPMTSLNPIMRVGRQVAEALGRHRGLSRRAALAAAGEAFEAVRIPDPGRRLSQYPHELSGGLRQRVMIAIALACRPEILIADEPTTALDVTTQAEILALIGALQRERGMTVLFITHDMGVVAEVADRVVVLRAGAVVERADVRTLFAAPATDYTRELLAATPRLGSGAPPPLADAPSVLRVEHLTTRFADPRRGFGWPARRAAGVTAVNDVSLTLRRGETLGLVGESGSGKSTLARSILRLVEPSAGSVRLGGEELMGLRPAALRRRRRHVQMVFQDPFASLNPRLCVRDLVTEPAWLHGLTNASGRHALAVRLLERVGLEAEAAARFPHQFSGGQRQRICIARALSVEPDLIVADEAVSALDVSIARHVTDLLKGLQEAHGMALLFISHDIAVVERVSHRIAVMRGGIIVESGPTAQVLSNPRHPYTRRLLAAVPVPDPAARRRATARPATPRPTADMASSLAHEALANSEDVS